MKNKDTNSKEKNKKRIIAIISILLVTVGLYVFYVNYTEHIDKQQDIEAAEAKNYKINDSERTYKGMVEEFNDYTEFEITNDKFLYVSDEGKIYSTNPDQLTARIRTYDKFKSTSGLVSNKKPNAKESIKDMEGRIKDFLSLDYKELNSTHYTAGATDGRYTGSDIPLYDWENWRIHDSAYYTYDVKEYKHEILSLTYKDFKLKTNCEKVKVEQMSLEEKAKNKEDTTSGVGGYFRYKISATIKTLSAEPGFKGIDYFPKEGATQDLILYVEGVNGDFKGKKAAVESMVINKKY